MTPLNGFSAMLLRHGCQLLSDGLPTSITFFETGEEGFAIQQAAFSFSRHDSEHCTLDGFALSEAEGLAGSSVVESP